LRNTKAEKEVTQDSNNQKSSDRKKPKLLNQTYDRKVIKHVLRTKYYKMKTEEASKVLNELSGMELMMDILLYESI
jgi:SOS response regulatory protein OraA/RecX